MGKEKRKEILQQLEKHRDSKVVAYLTSNRPNAIAQMKKDILPRFANQVRTVGKHRRLDVFIFTQGGDTITTFGLARLLREFADYIGVLVPDAGLAIAQAAPQGLAVACDRHRPRRGDEREPLGSSRVLSYPRKRYIYGYRPDGDYLLGCKYFRPNHVLQEKFNPAV